jgi:integrase
MNQMKQVSKNPTERIRVGDKVSLARRGKRGIWTAEFWHHGQHRHRSMKTADFRTARQRAMRLDIQIADGEYAAPARPVTLDQVIKEYMASKKGEGRSAKTIVKYQFELDTFHEFSAIKGASAVKQITPQLFEQYRADRMKGRSAKTLHTGLTIIKSFVKWIVLRQLLPANPLVSCVVAKPYSHPKTAATSEQVQKILAAATGDRRLYYAVAAYSGIRAGELRMLRPQDLDLADGWIHIVGRPGWMPKTRRSRKIPIHPNLAALLGTMTKHNRPYVFCARATLDAHQGDQPINVKESQWRVVVQFVNIFRINPAGPVSFLIVARS